MSKIFENIQISSINDKTFTINENKNGKLKKYVIKTPIMKIPFGVETYQGKYILNLEFTNKNKDDHVKLFHDLINNIDDYFRTLKGIQVDDRLLDLSKNKNYYTCVKNRPNEFDPLLRTNIKKNKNIIITEIVDKNNDPKTLFDLKPNNQIVAFIEISNLWIHDDMYGLYFNVKKIIIQ